MASHFHITHLQLREKSNSLRFKTQAKTRAHVLQMLDKSECLDVLELFL